MRSAFSQRTTNLFVIIVGVAALALSGCDGDDGNDGRDGPPGDTGSAGQACWDLNNNGIGDLPDEDTNGDGVVDVLDCRAPGADVGGADLGNPEILNSITGLEAEITGVAIASPPVVDFTLKTAGGTPVVNLGEAGEVRATIAKLNPAADGLPENYESYFNTIEEGGAPNVIEKALHAANDSGGELVDNGDGSYTYTFANDPTTGEVIEGAVAVPVEWEPDLTHAVGLEIRVENDDGVDLDPPNPVVHVIPSTGGAADMTKAIAATADCNSCHEKLAIHGNHRQTTPYCQTCHNPYTRDQNGGELVDLAYMTHSIHASSVRAGQETTEGEYSYIVYGFRDSLNDFSEVTYPQSTLYCENCHEAGEDTPDGDVWLTTATAEACGGCHVSGLRTSEPDPTTGLSTYSYEHQGVGLGEVPSGACVSCHGTNGFIDTREVHIKGARLERDLGEQFVFEILRVEGSAPGQRPVVRFRVSRPDGTPYDIVNDPEFGAGASLTVDIAWDTDDYYNEGSGSTGEDGSGPPGQPVGIGLAELKASAVPQSNGSYDITSPVAIPEGITGNVVVGLEGHPVVQVAGEDEPVEAAPVSIVFPTDPDGPFRGEGRPELVDQESCNNCHEFLAFHGNNRNNNAQQCILCHTADATDVRRRQLAGIDWNNPDPTDGRGEQSVAMGYMLHSLHRSNVVLYGFAFVPGVGVSGGPNDFTEVTYPGDLANCNACHVDDSYYGARSTARAITVGTGADRAVSADDEAITPTTAACYACHTDDASAAHMVSNGGYIADGDPATVEAVLKGDLGSTPATTESCGTCHGEGGIADVGVAHGLKD
jgi:OmcA/MtrC family decaheme c-type cytochrome